MTDYINRIDAGEPLSYEDSFEIACYCSMKISSSDDLEIADARKVVIHILNNWSFVPSETYPIWTDIVEAVGFYPYIEKNRDTMTIQSLADEVRQKTHLSDNLPDTYMHKEQKKLSDYLLSGKNVVASAPTSFGKSLLIEEVVASGKYSNIVIIQPTLALLDETRLKLKKYAEKYKIIVRTTQPPSEEKGNLFLLTAERVMEYDLFPHIDFLIIDEFYKLSLRRIDDRADALNNAFLKIVNTFNAHFYFLGPNIDGITEGFAQKYNAIFYKSDYSLVDCNVIDLSDGIDTNLNQKALDKTKLPKLLSLLDSLENDQTLVYCSAPARARRFAREYWNHLCAQGKAPKYQIPLVEWITQNVSSNWSLGKSLEYGIAVHDGSLQKHIGASIIKYFNDGALNFIFCTSTIIEGVNTSAKNVILLDGNKGSKELDFFDYSNIKGRSGRLMEHYVGNIFNLAPVPPQKTIIIDIPFYEQDKEVLTDEILVNIDSVDVQPQVSERYKKLNEIEPTLLEIIKRNGTNVNGQMNIYYALERDIQTSQYINISWTQTPSSQKLVYVLGLAENNTFSFENKHGVLSVAQLVFFIDIYRGNKSILSLAKKIYDDKMQKAKTTVTAERKQRYLDDAIELAFHIYRHWFQYTVPKALRVVDSLQRYVCERHGKKAGSYTFFAQQLENDFVKDNLSILIEYGIPSDTVRRITPRIPEALNEDGVIQYIKANKQEVFASLLQYEIDRLNQCL